MSVCLSVRPSSWNNCAPIGRILIKFYVHFSKKSAKQFQVSLKSVKNNRYFTWTSKNIMLISKLIIVTTTSFSDKSCTEIQNRHFSLFFFRKSSRLWDHVGKYGTAGQATDDYIIRRMRIALLTTKVYRHTLSVNNGYANAPQCHIRSTLPVLQYVWYSSRPRLYATLLHI